MHLDRQDFPADEHGRNQPISIGITLFSWGYYGWGNHTPRLIEAVDAVETSRGYLPPLFVDIRIRRSVRARGFQGTAFETLLGPSRHLWMKQLGNRFIETRTGPEIQIIDASGAEILLDHAVTQQNQRRRLLFFCSCQWPCCDGKINCHRRTVVELILDCARRQGLAVEVVEWPGGQPVQLEQEVTLPIFRSLRKERMSLPLGPRPDLALMAGLPWASRIRVFVGGESEHYLVGPAQATSQSWFLPLLSRRLEQPDDFLQEAIRLREQLGLEILRV